jgi:O-antigen/teichoic acid export membrane protein
MLVAYLLPVSSFGYYAVPYNLCRKLWILVGNVKAVVFPTVSALSAGEQSFQVRQLYLRGSKVVAAVLIFPGAVLSLLSHELLLHWISRDFADRGALTLSLLSVGNVVNGLMHIPDSLSQACGHPQLRAKLTGLQAALHAVLFVLLIPFFGLAGAAAGYVLAQLALAPWLIDKVNRIVGVTWKDVVLRCYLPVSIPTVAGCTVIMALRQFIHSFSTLACVVAAGSAIYGLLALWLSFDQKEKSVCLSFVGRA